MFIDSHTHLGLDSFCKEGTEHFRYDLQNNPDEFIKFMNFNNIDKAVILPIPGNNYDSIKSNEYLKLAYDKYPGRFIPFCKFDKNLAINLMCNHFYGAKYHMVYEKYSYSILSKYYKELEYYGFPLIIHAKFENKSQQIKDILSIAPNLKIIVAHMGRGHLYTDEMVEDLLNNFKDYPNVYFETSTVGRSRIIKHACQTIGSNRLLFGTDFPFGKVWFKNMYSYNDEVEPILKANISKTDIDNIFSKTMLSIVEHCDSVRNSTYVRPISIDDKDELISKVLELSINDKKLLALDKKMQLLKDCIRKCRHVYVAVSNNEIVGFFRESGRNNNTYVLEEIAVFEKYRGKGYSKKLMDYYVNFFEKSLSKTHANNEKMNNLLRKYNFQQQDGIKILNWTRGI